MPGYMRYNPNFQYYNPYYKPYSYNHPQRPEPQHCKPAPPPPEPQKKPEPDNPVWLDLFGIKLYFDDVLILSLLFFLYKEEVKYKMQHGYEAFIDKFAENFPPDNGREWIIDINRKNIGL